MTLQPFNRQAITAALVAWAESASALNGRVMLANQNAPQPVFPYVTLLVGPARSIGQDETAINAEPVDALPGKEVAIEVRGNREVTVSVNTYSMIDPATEDASQDAHALIEALITSLSAPLYLDPLRAAGVSVLRVSDPQNLDALQADGWKQRAQCDVTFSVAANAEERVTYIETVESTFDIYE